MNMMKAAYIGGVLALSVLLVFTACRGQKTAVPASPERSTSVEYVSASEAQTDEPETAMTEHTAASETTAAEETEAAAETTTPAAPTDTAVIVQMVNDAINRVADSKAPFTKTRCTDAENIDCSTLLKPIFEQKKADIYDFMGLDQQVQTRVTANGEEPYDHFIRHAGLTAADVDSAKCSVNADGNYQIELHIKDGKSHASKEGVTCTAPLDKCGIAVGKEDKSYWDHKTAENIYAALDEYDNAATTIRADEQYDRAVVKAVVQPDGAPVRVDVRFHVAYRLTAIRMYGSASGNTVITFDRFAIPKD